MPSTEIGGNELAEEKGPEPDAPVTGFPCDGTIKEGMCDAHKKLCHVERCVDGVGDDQRLREQMRSHPQLSTTLPSRAEAAT